MSTTNCPNGHPSASTDYCDTCGAPIGQPPMPDPSGASVSSPASSSSETGSPGAKQGDTNPAAPVPCPNCALVNTADALFCEGCGYDFTTGTMPRASAPTNPLDLGAAPLQPTVPDAAALPKQVEWVAEIWIDPDWYAEQHSDEPCPSPGLPVVVPLRTQSLLIGRNSRSRNIHPEVECSADIGVSRRQAQLTTDGQRWWVEDLQSSNGTYVAPASTALPTEPLTSGQRRELAPDDRIYVGAWTCIVVRRATPEEQAAQA